VTADRQFRALAALLGLVVVAACAIDLAGAGWSSAADAAAAVALGIGALVLLARRPTARTGMLLALAAIAWCLGTILPWAGVDGAFLVVALTLHRGPLLHALLAYPDGHLPTPLARLAATTAWCTGVVPVAAQSDLVTLALAALCLLAVAGAARSGAVPRRTRQPARIAAAAVASAMAVHAALRIGGAPGAGAATVYAVVVAAAAAAVALAARSGSRAAVADLVVDLGDRPDARTLRRGLAEALGDPDLVIGVWLPDEQRYVDEDGVTLDIAATAGRTSMPLVVDGDRVGILVYDTAVLDEPAVVTAAAAAGLAVRTVRLHSRSLAELAELDASRRRLVETVDVERRRLRAALAEGPEWHLHRAEQDLLAARTAGVAGLGVTLSELAEARAELTELAAGIHPAALADDGLAGALRARTAASSVPVDVHIAVGRLLPALEAGLALACSEALANAIKHAACTRVTIEIGRAGDCIVATVSDDGCGGADPRGFGLRGLADRVEALGGRLTIDSPVGDGTTIRATLPDGARTPSAAAMAGDLA
jgi:signal transduction histidine kinase